jgi:hypothetical protein
MSITFYDTVHYHATEDNVSHSMQRNLPFKNVFRIDLLACYLHAKLQYWVPSTKDTQYHVLGVIQGTP